MTEPGVTTGWIVLRRNDGTAKVYPAADLVDEDGHHVVTTGEPFESTIVDDTEDPE